MRYGGRKEDNGFLVYSVILSMLCMWSFSHFAGEPLWLAAVHSLIMATIFITDARDRVIPTTLVYPAFLFQLIVGYILYKESFFYYLILAAIITSAMAIMWLIGKKTGKNVGGGDVRLMPFLCMWQGIFSLATIGLASILALAFLLISREKKSPFGPFVVFSTIMIMAYGKYLVLWLLNMMAGA